MPPKRSTHESGGSKKPKGGDGGGKRTEASSRGPGRRAGPRRDGKRNGKGKGRDDASGASKSASLLNLTDAEVAEGLAPKSWRGTPAAELYTLADGGPASASSKGPLAGAEALKRVRVILGASDAVTVNVTHPSFHDTALQRAVARGRNKLVQVLVLPPTDVNTTNERTGDTALHLAVKLGHLAAARELLARGANVNAVNNAGETPLHQAAGAGRVDAVRMLAVRGAFVNAQDVGGHTPLHWAAGRPGLDERVAAATKLGFQGAAEALLLKGADANLKDNTGALAGDNAATIGRKGVAAALRFRTDPTLPLYRFTNARTGRAGVALVIGNGVYSKDAGAPFNESCPSAIKGAHAAAAAFADLRMEIFGGGPQCDLDSTAIRSVVASAAGDVDHSRSDCFVLYFAGLAAMGRGQDSSLLGTDGKQVLVEDVVRTFAPRACTLLAVKPKLFIVDGWFGSTRKSRSALQRWSDGAADRAARASREDAKRRREGSSMATSDAESAVLAQLAMTETDTDADAASKKGTSGGKSKNGSTPEQKKPKGSRRVRRLDPEDVADAEKRVAYQRQQAALRATPDASKVGVLAATSTRKEGVGSKIAPARELSAADAFYSRGYANPTDEEVDALRTAEQLEQELPQRAGADDDDGQKSVLSSLMPSPRRRPQSAASAGGSSVTASTTAKPSSKDANRRKPLKLPPHFLLAYAQAAAHVQTSLDDAEKHPWAFGLPLFTFRLVQHLRATPGGWPHFEQVMIEVTAEIREAKEARKAAKRSAFPGAKAKPKKAKPATDDTDGSDGDGSGKDDAEESDDSDLEKDDTPDDVAAMVALAKQERMGGGPAAHLAAAAAKPPLRDFRASAKHVARCESTWDRQLKLTLSEGLPEGAAWRGVKYPDKLDNAAELQSSLKESKKLANMGTSKRALYKMGKSFKGAGGRLFGRGSSRKVIPTDGGSPGKTMSRAGSLKRMMSGSFRFGSRRNLGSAGTPNSDGVNASGSLRLGDTGSARVPEDAVLPDDVVDDVPIMAAEPPPGKVVVAVKGTVEGTEESKGP